VGIFAHSALACVVDGKADASDLVEAIEMAADQEVESGNPNVTDAIVADSLVALDTWVNAGGMDYVGSLFNPKAEVHFERQLTPMTWVRGSADVVHDNGIADWKFPGSMQSWRKSWEKERYAVQPTVYLWALDKLQHQFDFWVCSWAEGSPVKVKTIRGDYVERDWDQKTVTARRNKADVAALRREVRAIEHLVVNGLDKPWPLRPTDWHCGPSWCPAYAQCMGHETDIDEKDGKLTFPHWVEAMADGNRWSSDRSFSYAEWRDTTNNKENQHDN
jgi:hypothetical protein